MKILALGDPHGKLPKNLDLIIKKNKIETIVCLGEVPPVPIIPKKGETFKHAELACTRLFKKIVDKLCSYKLPFLILRGNGYIGSKEGNKITRKIFYPHKNLFYNRNGKFRIHKLTFILFDMIWEEDIKNASKWTRNAMKSNTRRQKILNKLLKENKDCILISHAPPYGELDVVNNKRTNFKKKHVGSKILLEAVRKYPPKLLLCGHIHESKGKAKIGKTPVYNLGSHGDYAVIDTNNNRVIESNFLK